MSYPQGPQYGGYPQQPGGYPQPPSGGFPQQGYPQPPYPGPPRRNNNGLVIALAGIAAAAVIALVLVLVLSGKDDDGTSNTAETGSPGLGGNNPEVTIPPPNGGGRPSGGSGRPSGGSGSGGSSSARALAEQATSIIERRAMSDIDPLACSSTAAGELKRELGRVPAGTRADLDDVTESGSSAQATIKLDMSGQTQTITMEMRKSGSKWCASGI